MALGCAVAFPPDRGWGVSGAQFLELLSQHRVLSSISITLARSGLSFSLFFQFSVNRMQGEGRGAKKIGERKEKHSQSREMVINVYSFMKKEAEGCKVVFVNQIQNRVSEATGLSFSSLKRILEEYEHNKRVGKEFGTPLLGLENSPFKCKHTN
jgi:hypothetical protein